MAIISLRQRLDHAAEHGYGVPAFNVNNLEQIQAIRVAAEETRSPVILQASAGARKYAGEAYLRHLVLGAIEQHPDIPLVLHQDHGASPAVCLQSIRSGVTSVTMDGSLKEDAKTPARYDCNLADTAQVCEMAHAVGVSVEGELGCLGSLETGQAGEFDPRKALIAARKAARGICKDRFEAFGCAGHADRIKPIPLEAMVRRYA